MAIIDRDQFFTELANGTKWGAAVAFNRKNPLPLDDMSVFQSLSEAETYATSATAYPGQIISVLNDDGTNKYYGITQTGTLEELGASVNVDDKTIELGTDGKTLSLKNYGKEYYAYTVEEQDDGTHYVKTAGFIAGLEPRVITGTGNQLELAWYEPNPTTIEGVDAKITTLTQTVNSMDARVTANTNALEWTNI